MDTKSNDRHGIVLGIDLGTTCCLTAVYGADSRVEMVPNLDGEIITPSVLNLKDEAAPVVGRTAVNTMAYAPRYIVRLVKRMMGRVDAQNASIPAFVHPDSGRAYLPEELSAMILRYLKEGVEAATGRRLAGAVITVPAYFQDPGRLATRKAGELAGLNVLRIINEPTAAAIAFGMDRGTSGRSLIFDWGGGTLDVTLMDFDGRDFTAIASGGDRDLGGTDVDHIIAAWVFDQFKTRTGVEITAENDLATYYDVVEKCERAKKDLSRATSTTFVVSAGGQRMQFDITREQFEAWIAGLIDRARTVTEQVVKAAGLEWSEIQDVVLVGGSSRIPAVREMLRSLCGKPPRTDINADEAIARGAAIVAAKAAAESHITAVDTHGAAVLPPAVRFTDVIAHGLGCLAIKAGRGECNCVIIPANTVIPVEREDVFALAHERQTDAKVKVVQGENDATPNECTVIGEVILDGLPPGPLTPRIRVKYAYDAEGILSVTARDTVSGKTTNGVIQHRAGMNAKTA